MQVEAPHIRPITLQDNPAVEKLIRHVFEAMDIPKKGTAYEDKALTKMFESYSTKGAAYFVVEQGTALVGGAGIARLKNYDGNVCELQKMYFAPNARGKGWGGALLAHCLGWALELGYSGCYLETMPSMKAAQQLYRKNGFAYIDNPMGCTGHSSCPVYMYKTL